MGRATVQARKGGIKVARKVTEDDIKGWKEFRDKGYTYERIGKETKWGSETIRKHIGGERKLKEKEKGEKEKEEPETDLDLQARAFLRFEQGKGPTDLVEEKICTANVAQALWGKYTELKNMSRPELEILEARMENASYTLRHALGFAKMKILCPLCHEEGELMLLEIKGVKRWVCNSCSKIPF